MAELGRLLTAMVTPFRPDGSVDVARAEALALALLDSGSDGVVVTGTTGEAPTITPDEKAELFRAIRQAVGGRGTVVAGTGSNSTAAAIGLTRLAEEAGADGVLLVVPYYNKPTQEGLYQHFTAIARSTRLPCILYNVPSRTVTNLAAETVLRLSEVPNIVGVKEASGDLAQIEAIIRGTAGSGFRVWSGNDGDTCEVMQRGGYGVVSVASHLVGRQLREMLELCLRGEYERARTAHERLAPLFRDLFLVSNPIPVKHALNQIGFPVGGFRLPLCDPDPEAAARIMATVRRYTIDLPLPAPARGE